MLKNINYNKTYVSAQPGALVETFMGAFFLAVDSNIIPDEIIDLYRVIFSNNPGEYQIISLQKNSL